jgi:Txe/YoeB family toxin of toxin-antitoxin system
MRLVFTPNGWEDYRHWLSTDRATLTRVNQLIDDILRDPFDGIGKPEALRHATPSPAAGRDASARSTGSSTSSTATTS